MLGNIKYLFMIIQLIRIVSGFEPKSLEDTCLESKWKIKR